MGAFSADAAISELTRRLLRARQADGGWGYYAGKSSRLEPTAWALMALDDVSAAVVQQWPAADGLLLERAGGEPNFGFHGLALLVLLHLDVQHEAGNPALLAGIQRVKGIPLDHRGVNRQNNRLQAWSWVRDTFSWVEPTAYCLLALKKAKLAGLPVDDGRIADAEGLLFDRCGVHGGWNYGNSNMLGQELASYVPTTALGLLALQDHRSHEAVLASRDHLERDALSERSSLALSLAMIALRVLGRPVDGLRTALLRQIPTTLALGNLHAAALALYALRTDHADAAFVLQ